MAVYGARHLAKWLVGWEFLQHVPVVLREEGCPQKRAERAFRSRGIHNKHGAVNAWQLAAAALHGLLGFHTLRLY